MFFCFREGKGKQKNGMEGEAGMKRRD